MNCCGCANSQAIIHLTWMCGDILKYADLCCECSLGAIQNEDPYGIKLLRILTDIHCQKGQSVRSCCREDSHRCPMCQFPLDQFKEKGQVGCPECYTHLCQDELQSALQLSQRALDHQGKVPLTFQIPPEAAMKNCHKIKSKSSDNDLSYSV